MVRSKVRARAPLRLGFAGGGTDVAPYRSLYGGEVLNATIALYAHSFIELLDDPVLELRALDIACEQVIPLGDLESATPKLALHLNVYRVMMERFNEGRYLPLKLVTFSDVPAGSGLGASSTIVVSMITGLAELMAVPLGEYEVAQLAFDIERNICGFAGGAQDQFSASFGGFNLMEFHAGSKTIVNPLRVKNRHVFELEASMLLYFTGRTRESAAIIERQVQAMAKGERKSLDALHQIKAQCSVLKEALLTGRIADFGAALHDSWLEKRKVAKGISNDAVDTLYASVRSRGVIGGKISGAGGGGFMLLLCEPESRHAVENYLNTQSGMLWRCHFELEGAQSWRA